MKTSSAYPVIACTNVIETANFYRRHFGFEPAFESDWYIHLQSADDPGVNLAVLDCHHETVPEGFRHPVRGMLVNFEVDDVDAEHERLVAEGVPIVRPLKSEAFGQRHFITHDPAGVLVDVITVIPPDEAFAAQYLQGEA